MPNCEWLAFEEFERAEQAWDDLVRGCAHPLPFMSHPWICTWWRCFGAGQEFTALVVGDAGRWLAGVPLAIRPVRWGPWTIRIAEIAGTGPVPTRGLGLSDKAELVVHRDHLQAGQVLVEALGTLLDRVDLLHLKGFDQASQTARLLSRGPAGRRVRISTRSRSPYLPLAGRLEDSLRSRPRKFSKTLAKGHRVLAAKGRVEFTRFEPGDDCAPWFEHILAVSRTSWQARRGTDLFRHPALAAFFAELLSAMAEHGWLDLHLLRLDGRALAYELGFDFCGRVFAYTAAFDPTAADLSPGTQLSASVIDQAGRRGRIEYDLLRGQEPYKRRWTKLSRTQLEAAVHAGGLRARLYADLGIQIKQRLRSWPWLRRVDERISGILGRLRPG